MSDERLNAVQATLREVFTEEGAETWWTRPNLRFGGISPNAAWSTGDEKTLDHIEGTVEGMTGMIAT